MSQLQEGGGAMRPWAPQYPVRTQVVSRTLFEPREILFEPRQGLFLFKLFFLNCIDLINTKKNLKNLDFQEQKRYLIIIGIY